MIPGHEIDPELVKDDDTVVSESSVEVVAVSIRRKGPYGLVAAGLFVLFIVVIGVTVGIGKSSKPTPFHRPPGEYKLSASFGPVVSGIYSDSNQLGFFDPDTGCIQIIVYENGEARTPLCEDFGTIRSLSLQGNFAIVAHDDVVETWELSSLSNEWACYPPSKIAGVAFPRERKHIIRNSDPGFGKKTVMVGNKLYIASDERVYYFQNFGHAIGWYERNSWDAIGFDINQKGTVLAVYTSDTVDIYTMKTWIDKLGKPKIHSFEAPISTTVVTDDGQVHVVFESSDSFQIQHLTTSDTSSLDMAATIVGDAIYSADSLIDIATGSEFNVTINAADEIYQVQASVNHILVVLERDGSKMAELYEN